MKLKQEGKQKEIKLNQKQAKQKEATGKDNQEVKQKEVKQKEVKENRRKLKRKSLIMMLINFQSIFPKSHYLLLHPYLVINVSGVTYPPQAGHVGNLSVVSFSQLMPLPPVEGTLQPAYTPWLVLWLHRNML